MTEVLDLDEHEALGLLQLCRTAHMLDTLQAVVNRDGVLLDSSHGVRAHPALVELRQLRITFARPLSAMQLPSGLGDAKKAMTPAGAPAPAADTPQRTQRRPGVRGVYAIDGGRV